MYTVTEYQFQQLRNRYPRDEVVKEIGRQPQPPYSSTETDEEVCPKFKANASCDCFPNGWWCGESPCLISRAQH